jgi:protease-4
MVFRRYLVLGAGLVGAFLASAALPLRAEDSKPAKTAKTDKADKGAATIAHIKFGGALEEKLADEDPFFGATNENLKAKLDRIKKAQTDANVKGLILEIDGLGVGWGKLNELRHAVADFRKSGKKAYAFMESGATKDYLLAAACDEICVPEAGWLVLTGMRAEVSFYKDLLGKLGVKADMLQMGAYKGAAEPLTRSSMSKELRERLESVLDDDFEHEIVGAIVHSRPAKHWTPEQVKKLLDQGPFNAHMALAAGLIDRIVYFDQVQDALKGGLRAERVKLVKNYGQKKGDDVDFANPFAVFAKLFKPPSGGESNKPNKIAVIYATGAIVTGKGGSGFMDGETIGSTTMVETIRKAEEDATVKAIVLRVDSPGGSALASDLIWNELRKSKKPVVASMSDVAASGGYYISMGARKIYAEPGTLTGSVGVVGGKIVLGGLYDKIGIKTEVISRGANSGVFSTTTPFTESEEKALRALMQDIYNQFVDKAMQGRERAGKKFTREEFLQLAEGRVWTGRQAKANGLIDEMGTLDDAVAAAKEMAGLKKDADIDLLILPRPRTFLDILKEGRAESRLPGMGLREAFGGLPEVLTAMKAAGDLLQLRGEPVWLILPHRLEIK